MQLLDQLKGVRSGHVSQHHMHHPPPVAVRATEPDLAPGLKVACNHCTLAAITHFALPYSSAQLLFCVWQAVLQLTKIHGDLVRHDSVLRNCLLASCLRRSIA